MICAKCGSPLIDRGELQSSTCSPPSGVHWFSCACDPNGGVVTMLPQSMPYVTVVAGGQPVRVGTWSP